MAENNSNCENEECIVLNFSEIFQLINLLKRKNVRIYKRPIIKISPAASYR